MILQIGYRYRITYIYGALTERTITATYIKPWLFIYRDILNPDKKRKGSGLFIVAYNDTEMGLPIEYIIDIKPIYRNDTAN